MTKKDAQEKKRALTQAFGLKRGALVVKKHEPGSILGSGWGLYIPARKGGV